MPEDTKKPSPVTRREFLRTGAVGAVATGVAPGVVLGAAATAAAGEAHAEAAAPIVGPGVVSLVLDVNGKARKVSIEPRVTLLEALRDVLDLTGAKKVCDRGTCGACTVLLDGNPAYACSVLAVEARGKKIVTVEGLGGDAALHPIQAAFVANDALQCGFCTPGFVVATKALLDREPNPSDEEIDRALGGNLCRCGTYAGMRRAVKDAAAALARKG